MYINLLVMLHQRWLCGWFNLVLQLKELKNNVFCFSAAGALGSCQTKLESPAIGPRKDNSYMTRNVISNFHNLRNYKSSVIGYK